MEKLPKLKPGMKVVIPSKSNRKTRRDYDVEMNKTLIENFIGRAKEKGEISTRFDKTDSSYASRCYFVGMLEALK